MNLQHSLSNIKLFVLSLALLISISYCAVSYGQLSALPPQVWPESPITISFAPDHVAIGRFRNELQQHLKSSIDEKQWRIEILRACQEWSRNCGIDFALIVDSPRDFGVPGMAQGDPRFGDIRFGAFPQTNVLGNAIPYQPNAGTWAGDIFLDTNTFYEIQNRSGDSAPSSRIDLFSVVLHELGNSLGLLDETLDPDSVMFYRYLGTRERLASSDIQNAQFLYGPKTADSYEDSKGNDKLTTASVVNWSEAFIGEGSQTIRGRIQSSGDVDIYRIRGSEISEKIWVTVTCQGLSLLCPKLTILNDEGKVIDTIGANSPLCNSVTKELTNFYVNETRYLVVEWNDVPDFEFGNYQIELQLNQPPPQPPLGEGSDDDELAFSESADEAFEDQLFDSTGPVDTEFGSNDTPSNATELYSPKGMQAGSRFETLGTLVRADVDCYGIQTAADSNGSMMIHLRPLTASIRQLSILVLDSNLKAVNSIATYHSDGDIDLEVSRVLPNSRYYLIVSQAVDYDEAVNYLLVADVAALNTNLNSIQQVRLNTTSTEAYGAMTTYKTQLFKFSLNVQSQDKVNQAVQLTIYSETGRVEATIVCKAGNTSRNMLWLDAGKHTFRFTALTKSNRRIVATTSTLRGASVSDDEGPILIDPSGNPVSGTQLPDNNPPPTPLWEFPKFLLGLILPPENPWFSPLTPNGI